jgi:hypothetical protein
MNTLTRWDIFLGALGAMTPLLAIFLAAHWQNRNDKRKSDQRMDTLLQEYPIHDHTEQHSEPLLASGIRFPKSNGRVASR